MARKTPRIRKVRAWVTDERGGVYMNVADAPHVLQLPGGSVKRGESWRKAIRREVAEETGFTDMKISRRCVRANVRRNGAIEVTRTYRVTVRGKRRTATLSAREMRRGLTLVRFPNRKKALAALAARVAAYGRSAARRDLRLARAILDT